MTEVTGWNLGAKAVMRIGDLAARADVSVRSLRYYEEQGLLAATRSASGQRLYADSDVERVRFLQHLYAAGLSSRTIAELLPCVESPSVENADEAWDRLVRERDRLDAHITDLLHTRDLLDSVMAANRRHRQAFAPGAPAATAG